MFWNKDILKNLEYTKKSLCGEFCISVFKTKFRAEVNLGIFEKFDTNLLLEYPWLTHFNIVLGASLSRPLRKETPFNRLFLH